MGKLPFFIAVVLALAIFVCFFLPWVSIESQVVGQFSKVLTGKKQASIDTISGFQIPILANRSDSRFIMSIIKIFNPDIKDADKKSFLIWVVPLLAIILAGLVLAIGKNKWFNLTLAVVGVGIFLGAVYKIKTTDLNKLVLNVRIAGPLWCILWSYLGMGLVGAVSFVRGLGKK